MSSTPWQFLSVIIAGRMLDWNHADVRDAEIEEQGVESAKEMLVGIGSERASTMPLNLRTPVHPAVGRIVVMLANWRFDLTSKTVRSSCTPAQAAIGSTMSKTSEDT